ncbi:MAG: lysophospholipid acyltransferase family protein [Bacteroidetes bacterium]|nr:lysophospholipid acyltransferase family protein [Bacteroidota bacterium]
MRHGQGRVRSLISVFRNFFLFGQVLIDKTAILAGMRDKFNFIIEGKEYLMQMHNGGILISGHIGNWEVGGKALDVLNKKINVIVFDAEHQAIQKYMSKTLTDRNVHFIRIGNDFSHLLEIKQALANKEIIAMHGDRFVEGNQAVRIDFLGEKALFPFGPWHIASFFNVPVSYVFAVKEAHKQYRFFATPLKIVPSARNPLKRSALIADSMKEYVSELEKAARKYPLQWYNYYNFWE